MKRNTILKNIGEPNLQLYQGLGYFYFVYDDREEIYDEYCVYVEKLSHLDIKEWVEEGNTFMKKVKEEHGI